MEATCRTCLCKNATVSVFDVEEEVSHSVRLSRCAGLVVEEQDSLPKLMCSACVVALAAADHFVQSARASERLLRDQAFLATRVDDLYPTFEVPIKQEQENGIKLELDGHYEDDLTLQEFSESQRSADPLDGDVEEQESTEKTKEKHSRKKKVIRGKLGPIQCVVCGLMVVCSSAMETHMRTHTGEKPFACESCSMRFPTKGALKRHVTTNHSPRVRKFTCETCGNSFFTKSDIITHMRIHTDEKPYVCPFCSKAFRQIASLIRHKRVHTGEKPYSCPICGKKFADKNLVNKHLQVHSNVKKFSCHLCNKAMKSKTALNTHLSLHSNEKKNICSFCGMAFAMKGNLQTHIKRVHSERSGQCDICLKMFSDIEDHMRKHTGEKPFGCALCGRLFGSRRSLNHHTAFKHENAAKYKCSIGECGRGFPTAVMLQFHRLKQHSQHTPYVCPYCARGFYRTSDLSRHLKVSHANLHLKTQSKVHNL